MNGYEYLESCALKEVFTDADQKELLGEITNAAIVYAKDFRLELHGIASVLVWIEAAKRYAHTGDNAPRMQHFALEHELAKVWDSGESRKSTLNHARADNLIIFNFNLRQKSLPLVLKSTDETTPPPDSLPYPPPGLQAMLASCSHHRA
ncbi:hypothetical protein SAMN05216404_12217 [Nitrosospira multiformis]|uniref:Uncharacterized protein n=1 Tax=Nitrosospira multiformis TaxID=1231 RepID=A0A1H8PQ60_9PROT|nr:hypothetical protein SAMN05216404_12217 [Nitrosospira multiformis]